MPRPKGYKLSEEAKRIIGEKSRLKWEARRAGKQLQTPEEVAQVRNDLFPPTQQEQPKNKWWEFWK
jgi:hypothetical protein